MTKQNDYITTFFSVQYIIINTYKFDILIRIITTCMYNT